MLNVVLNPFLPTFRGLNKTVALTKHMSNKKELSFPLIIIAIVIGVTIFKQFDFENLKFEKPAMAVVYILTFLMTVYLIFKKKTEK
jgi:predicted ferric reductase